jgi:hypothetical protein
VAMLTDGDNGLLLHNEVFDAWWVYQYYMDQNAQDRSWNDET